MFKCYNLLACMEWGAASFWGWPTRRALQDPTVTSLKFHTLIFWGIDISNYVKYCEVWLRKHMEF
jgi:hypothetical protein